MHGTYAVWENVLNQAGISRGCKLYSTHIDETDISLGDTRRLNRTIAQIVERDKPKIIFCCHPQCQQLLEQT